MKRFILCYLVMFIFGSTNYGQTTNDPLKVPVVIPKSPEAENLGRYGEVVVGEYTGTPNISIPLHVIKSGKLEFPINLYYNASGIRVNQEATWVGLGWELSAVAGITSMPSGKNDQTISDSYPDWSDWEKTINSVTGGLSIPAGGHEDGLIGWGGAIPDGMWPINTPATVVLGANLLGMGQHDLFSVNCGELSFKFYIHPKTNVCKIYGEKNKCKIEIINNNINVGFLITDENGIQYRFQTIETELSSHAINSWFLSEIRNPEGEWIRFTYTNFGTVKLIPPASEKKVSGGVLPIGTTKRDIDLSVNSIENQYLTTIESITEVVIFNLESRQDIAGDGARKLESISITDKFSNHKKLYSFSYDYFEACYIGGDYLNDETNNSLWPSLGLTVDNLKKRLKLVGVTEKDEQDNSNKKYSFGYSEDKLLPYKTSFAIDHWGYYNGQENISNLIGKWHTIVPNLNSCFYYDPTYKDLFNDVDLYNGAKRGMSGQYITTNMLKSITYPTGGKTEFTFEPNSFNNHKLLSAEEENQIVESVKAVTVSDFNNGVPTSAQFTLTSETLVDFVGDINNEGGKFTTAEMAGTNILLFGPNGSKATRWNFDGTYAPGEVYNKTWSQQILLAPGTYALSCYLPDALGFQGYNPLVTATIKYRAVEDMNKILANHISKGGGVRIAKIENYDSNNKILTSRLYNYVNTDGSTSGKLLSPLTYIKKRTWTIGVILQDHCNSYNVDGIIRNSSGSLSLSVLPMKATIGYDRIEITDVDEINHTNGKIIKNFYNEKDPDILFDDLIYNASIKDVIEAKNGDLISTTYLNNNSDTIRNELYHYKIEDPGSDCINLKVDDLYFGDTQAVGLEQYCACAYKGRYLIEVYPYMNYKKFLENKIETDYTPSGKIIKKTDYTYNLDNYEPSEIKTVDSNGDILTTELKYPKDFTDESSIYSSMVTANMIDPVVEQTKYKNTTQQLERVKTNYSLVDGFLIKPQTVEQQIKDNPTQTVITYGRYANGNVAEYQSQDGIYTSFIWGYNQTLPIAKVINARYKDIFYTGFEDGEGTGTENDSKTGHWSRTGGYAKSLTGLTRGAYNLTYWLKTGNQWNLQAKTVYVTDAAGTYTINFTNQEQVDDVRFFPAEAQMTIYSYDPLVGITTSTDANNFTTYYEYDLFGRFKLVRDKDGKVLKQYQYHYQNQQ